MSVLDDYNISIKDKLKLFKTPSKPYIYKMPLYFDMWNATASLQIKLILDDLLDYGLIKEYKIKGGGQYKNQISLINSLFGENINSIDEYHNFIASNVDLIENNINYIINSFKTYLDKYNNSSIGLKTA